ncbi:MAG: His-Xaa-Ser system protein HxsD [Myxococcales bacterium]|nr:His-Xaa-Ser system protein HxsD [Myxococcales bacterium]
MTETPPNVTVEASQGAVHLEVDPSIYPLEAIYGAAYVFIDRCYVFLYRPREGAIRITLSTKAAEPGEAALAALVGEFSNELLSCAWRRQITEENRTLIEAVTSQALAGAMGPPSLDDLADFDFSDEGFEDPLGIAQSWEEKHGRKAPRGGEGGEGQSEGGTP